MKIGLIDYSIGNLFSVNQACLKTGFSVDITQDPDRLRSYDGIILPGVGAFAQGMENLHQLNLIEPIHEFIKSGKPFMGICLGMQLLFQGSNEFAECQGLGVFNGQVRKLRDQVAADAPVPQIMWNEIHQGELDWQKSALKDIPNRSYFYFVHSFYCDAELEDSLARTEYFGFNYTSSVCRENVFATQFHPEKSGEWGLKIYENWKNLYL